MHSHSRQLLMPGLHIHLIPCLRWHLGSIGPHCFDSRQLLMPGLHIHLMPCLRWHLGSIGPHCFVLKNSGLFLACTAPIQLSFCNSHYSDHSACPEALKNLFCMCDKVHGAGFRIKAVACTMQWIVQVCPPLQLFCAYGIMSSFRNIVILIKQGHCLQKFSSLEHFPVLKLLSQNMHTAFLVLQPFLASVLFVTAKYCQTKSAVCFLLVAQDLNCGKK